MVTFNTSKSFTHNKSKRFLGIEIEIAYSNPDKHIILKNTAKKWHGDVGHDGSIDSNEPPKDFFKDKTKYFEPSSYEIRTAPTNGDLFIKQIMEYGYALHASNSFANITCGLHVHVDARDLTNMDLDKTLLLWSKVERPMFTLVHPDRADTEWCAPWEFKSDIRDIEDTLDLPYDSDCDCDNCWNGNGRCKNKKKSRILEKIKEDPYGLERYMALNLCALGEHGTLENRMHHGTTNPDTIINWALINASIVDYAQAHSMPQISKLPRSFDTLLSVIRSDKVRKWAIDRKDSWKHRPVTTLYQDQIDDRKWYSNG